MKKLIFLVLSSMFLLSIVSCNHGTDDDQSGTKDSFNIAGIPEALKKRLTEQDSLSREMVAKIDSITIQLSNSRKQIESLQSEVKKIQEPGQVLACIAIVALFLSLIALVLTFVRTRNTLNKKKAKDYINGYLEESYDNPNTAFGKIKTLSAHIQGIESRMRPRYSDNQGSSLGHSELSDLEKRVTDLERIMKLKDQRNDTQKPSSYDTGTPKVERLAKQESTKVGYANINTSNYFVDLVDSKQETCVFTITFKGQEQGEFNIISLDKLKSRNGWQDVVEATGDCTMAEANSYDVLGLGQCKKIEDNTWEVTRKLRIKIRK